METCYLVVVLVCYNDWWGRRTAHQANVSPSPCLMQGVFCCLCIFSFCSYNDAEGHSRWVCPPPYYQRRGHQFVSSVQVIDFLGCPCTCPSVTCPRSCMLGLLNLRNPRIFLPLLSILRFAWFRFVVAPEQLYFLTQGLFFVDLVMAPALATSFVLIRCLHFCTMSPSLLSRM